MIKKVVYTEYYCNNSFKCHDVEVYHTDNNKSYFNSLMPLSYNVMMFMRYSKNIVSERIKVGEGLTKRITTYC